jgi:threonine/homoserine/homoserine lactone efflux protein
MNPFESAAFGLALGFSLTVPPGPMNALIASISARSFRAGFVTGLGAMSADLVLGAVVLTLSTEFDLRAIVRPVDALGAIALAFYGWRILRRPVESAAVPAGDARTFSQAIGLGLTNPFQVVWWLTAGLAFARLGGAILLVGLFGAVAVWVVVFPYAIASGARRWPNLQRGIVLLSGAIMLAFAAYFAVLAAGFG